MRDLDFGIQAEIIVLTNDQAEMHARISAIEHHLEHADYPPEFQLDSWAREFREDHERAVNDLTQVLKTDHEFKVLTVSIDGREPDTFSQDEYDEGMTIDEYCEICHGDPDGCDACQDS